MLLEHKIRGKGRCWSSEQMRRSLKGVILDRDVLNFRLGREVIADFRNMVINST